MTHEQATTSSSLPLLNLMVLRSRLLAKAISRTSTYHRANILGKVERMVDNDEKKITRVLFCGPHFPASHTYTREYLKEYPFVQVDDVPLDDVAGVIQNYNICIVKTMKFDSILLSHAEKMKLIMQYGVGLEGVDIDSATEFGIKVARIPSHVTGNAASCAEMAIYLMLGLLRKQNEMQIAIKQRKVGDPIGDMLLGKTALLDKIFHKMSFGSMASVSLPNASTLKIVAKCVPIGRLGTRVATDVFILGFGNIGIDLAKRLRPFGVKIIATKRSWATHSLVSCLSNVQNGPVNDFVDEKGGHEDIHKFASKADIVESTLVVSVFTTTFM
ncbi:D-isomer specific 2-hydroxyacid dehydrogenase family protein [Prunus dulcis]|uniref:D-isomer specific 2-hydroxyacid dehydrogenase family protein n=1 Tax=Prunus dulcis TaxID=3755 RepID=A0A4Y1QVZ8_PRUDU|nr:D-isomer specific 2-hydroxyacid dehydrogenase family protein [Prunus dulcis]